MEENMQEIMKDNIKGVSGKGQAGILEAKDIAVIAMFVAFISVCAQIKLDVGPVPFTLQTFAVCITSALLGAKRGIIAVLCYILLGTVGVPVFQGFTGGAGIVMGITGGFIIGFLFIPIIIGMFEAVAKKNISGIVLIIALIIGDALCMITGMSVAVLIHKWSVYTAFAQCVAGFILPDLAKIVLAAWFVRRVRQFGVM